MKQYEIISLDNLEDMELQEFDVFCFDFGCSSQETQSGIVLSI